MTEWPPNQSSTAIRPMSDEEADRIGEVLKEARALGERMLARRKGKPLASSWQLIRQEREKRSKHL